MADSTYLKNVVESHIASWVSQRIGPGLLPKSVPVGSRSDGRLVHFEFDGVSEDAQVGLLVSSGYTFKPGGTRKLHVDAAILLNAQFQRRIMAFVSQNVCDNFLNKCDGLLPLSKIEMLVCESFPADMKVKTDEFHLQARAEVGDKGRIWKVGRPAEIRGVPV